MDLLTDKIEEAFSRWDEDGFSREVLAPLLMKMGFQAPRFVGGADEKGIDVLYHETILPEGFPRFTGIQVKKGNVTARVEGGLNPRSLEPQIRQAFEKLVGLPGQQPYTRISSLVICATGKITGEAQKEIENGLQGERRLGAPIRFWAGSDVAAFIEQYWLQDFAHIAGIELPPNLQQVILQGDHTPFSVGIALARAGQHQAAIPLLRQSLLISAIELASAHIDPNPDVESMLRAAKVAIEYDKDHYNQFWIAGYAEFLRQNIDSAEHFLEEAIRILEADRSELVQRGAGFQERYLQALGMLVQISRTKGEGERLNGLILRYREKHQSLIGDLNWKPRPLGDWEVALQKELAL